MINVKITVNGSEYTAGYDKASESVKGFTSDDAFYNVYLEFERAINKVVGWAYENDDSVAFYVDKKGNEFTALIG